MFHHLFNRLFLFGYFRQSVRIPIALVAVCGFGFFHYRGLLFQYLCCAVVLFELYNGDIATRIGVSDNGWSKLEYNGVTCYGITSYMTKVDAAFVQQAADDDVGMDFEAVVQQVVTTKAVNLRTLPSTERSDSKVVVKLEAGETLTRIGINKELEWSQVIYQGQTLYCVSWYLTEAE